MQELEALAGRLACTHASDEQIAQVRGDDLLEQDKPHPLRPFIARQRDHPIQQRRDLHHPVELLAGLGILHQQHDVQALVVDMRERMAGIDRERRQDRVDLAREQPIEVLPLGRLERIERHPLDASRRQAGHDLAVQQAMLLGHERMDARLDPSQLLHGIETIRTVILRLQTRVQLLLQPRDPHLEELVEIRAEDRGEFEPLEQRIRRIRRFLQHTRVELEPAELTVEVVVGGKGRLVRRHLQLAASRSRGSRRSAARSGRGRTRCRRPGSGRRGDRSRRGR